MEGFCDKIKHMRERKDHKKLLEEINRGKGGEMYCEHGMEKGRYCEYCAIERGEKISKEYSAEEVEKYLSEIRDLGPEKPMGYLPINFIEELGSTIGEEMSQAKKNGHDHLLVGPETGVIGGALYIYDIESLQSLIDDNRNILKKADWPIAPKALVEKISTEHAPIKTELFNVIADAFGDSSNPNRL
jgi:hypothetical protein